MTQWQITFQSAHNTTLCKHITIYPDVFSNPAYPMSIYQTINERYRDLKLEKQVPEVHGGPDYGTVQGQKEAVSMVSVHNRGQILHT